MSDLIIPLMKEYHKLLEVEAKFEDWKSMFPDYDERNYQGERIPKERFRRTRLMLHQAMIDHERRS